MCAVWFVIFTRINVNTSNVTCRKKSIYNTTNYTFPNIFQGRLSISGITVASGNGFILQNTRIFFLYNLPRTYLAFIIFRLLRIGHLKLTKWGKTPRGKTPREIWEECVLGGFELQVHFCAFPSLCLFCYSYTSCNVNIVTRRTRTFFACIDKLVNGFVTTCS